MSRRNVTNYHIHSCAGKKKGCFKRFACTERDCSKHRQRWCYMCKRRPDADESREK